MNTPLISLGHLRKRDLFLAMAARYRARAEVATYPDLKDSDTKLADGYEALAESFARLDAFSG
jgi:hypothetical protein